MKSPDSNQTKALSTFLWSSCGSVSYIQFSLMTQTLLWEMLEKNEEPSPAVRHTHTYSCFVPFGVLLLSHHWFAFYPSGLSNTNRVILGAQLYSLFFRSVSHVTVGQSDVVIFHQHKQWGELKPNKIIIYRDLCWSLTYFYSCTTAALHDPQFIIIFLYLTLALRCSLGAAVWNKLLVPQLLRLQAAVAEARLTHTSTNEISI